MYRKEYPYSIEDTRLASESMKLKSQIESFMEASDISLGKKIVDRFNLEEYRYLDNVLEKSSDMLKTIVVDKSSTSLIKGLHYTDAELSSLHLPVNPKFGFRPYLGFKPQYINMYLLDVGGMLDKIVSGKVSPKQVKKFMDTNTFVDMKRRVAKENIPSGKTAKRIEKMDYECELNLTTDYLKDVYDFYGSFEKEKNDTLKTVQKVSQEVNTTPGDFSAYKSTLAQMEEELSPAVYSLATKFLQKTNQVFTATYRFILFAMTSTITSIIEDVNQANRIYNVLEKAKQATMITESVVPETVISLRIGDLADNLLHGRIDGYVELSTSIYNYHYGVACNCGVLSPEVKAGNIKEEILSSKYMTYPYDDTIDSFDMVKRGLEIISEWTDGFVDVFDDVVGKAGLDVPLDIRFQNVIESIKDTSIYTSSILSQVENSDDVMYLTMIHEMHDMPENISAIETIITDNIKVIKALQDKFNENFTGEYIMQATAVELREFIEELRLQHINYVKAVAEALFNRIRDISKVLSEYSDKESFTVDSVSLEESSMDFTKGMYDTAMDISELIQEAVMGQMLRDFYAAKEMKERGVRVVYEDENQSQPQQTQNQSQSQNANQQNSGTQNSSGNSQGNSKPTLNTGNNPGGTNDSGKPKKNLENIKAALDNWFQNIYQSFVDMIGKAKKTKLPAIEKASDYVKNKNYTNVSLSDMVPYEDGMPYNDFFKIFDEVANTLRTMKPDVMKTINTQEDFFKRCLPKASLKGSISEMGIQIQNYCSCGTKGMDHVSYSNGNLKQLANTAVDFCLQYYGNKLDTTLKSKMDIVKKSAQDASALYTTEAVESVAGLIYCEDDQNSQSQQNTNSNDGAQKAKSNMDKSSWLTTFAEAFCGQALNSLKNRAVSHYNTVMTLNEGNPNKDKDANANNDNNQNNGENQDKGTQK